MQKSKQRCLRAALVSICVMLMLFCSCAYADETVNVRIPVVATGADCLAELYNSEYFRVDRVELKAEVPDFFTVSCTGLKRTTFIAMLYNKDSDAVQYDHRQYTIHVDVFLNAQGQPTYIVSIENPANPSSKLDMVRFFNIPQQLEPTPTPVPTPNPSPTPEPYDYVFTFTKRWSGDHEDSIDWVMYNADGTQRHKLFNRKVISDYEWYYEAYFTSSVDDCYVIEYPPEGYVVHYENVGRYADVTDRCYSGGTIINHKIPQTNDDTPLAFYHALIVISMLGLCLMAIKRRQRQAGKES